MRRSIDADKAGNSHASPTFFQVLEARLSRRGVLKGAVAAAVLGSLPPWLAGCATGLKRQGALGFKGISVSTADMVRVPEGYTATPLNRWGDPVGHPSGSPAFKPDASNTADEQKLQAGMHHDGMHYFPLPYYDSGNSENGLLAVTTNTRTMACSTRTAWRTGAPGKCASRRTRTASRSSRCG